MHRATSHGSAQARAADSLTHYFREISEYPTLTREQEFDLARRIRAGDSAALQQLACANLRFVVSVAKKYQHQGVALADLINEGNMGLLYAAERYDESRGVKFISYAVWWVRQAILQAIAEQGHAVRIPLSRASARNLITRRSDMLSQDLGREPTLAELSSAVQMSEKEITATLPLARAYMSLDAPLGEEGNTSLLDTLADDDEAAPDAAVADERLREMLSDMLQRLQGRDAAVLQMYFGLDGSEPKTLDMIGAELGVTRERARQIKERALRRIRKMKEAKALAAFH